MIDDEGSAIFIAEPSSSIIWPVMLAVFWAFGYSLWRTVLV